MNASHNLKLITLLKGTIMKIRSTTDLYYAIPATVLLAVMLVYIS